MPSRLPIITTIRGQRAYLEFLRELAEAEKCRSVTDLIDRAVSHLAARHRLTPPDRLDPAPWKKTGKKSE